MAHLARQLPLRTLTGSRCSFPTSHPASVSVSSFASVPQRGLRTPPCQARPSTLQPAASLLRAPVFRSRTMHWPVDRLPCVGLCSASAPATEAAPTAKEAPPTTATATQEEASSSASAETTTKNRKVPYEKHGPFLYCRVSPALNICKERLAGQPLDPERFSHFTIEEAVTLARLYSFSSFDESIDVAMRLGVDVRKPGQLLRGIAEIPFAFKPTRVAVFAVDLQAEAALQAGADVVGGEDLVADIQAGKIDFDRCFATPDMMPIVGRVARILGPRGLMPNPRMGSIVTDVRSAVQKAKSGQVLYRTEKNGIIHAPIGRVSFPIEQTIANARAFIQHIMDIKPMEFGGQYVHTANISTTHGQSWRLNRNIPPFAFAM